jgi:hypothetical protein
MDSKKTSPQVLAKVTLRRSAKFAGIAAVGVLLGFVLGITGCAPSALPTAAPTQAPAVEKPTSAPQPSLAPTQVFATQLVEMTAIVEKTPQAFATATAPLETQPAARATATTAMGEAASPTAGFPTDVIEGRQVELEYPATIRLGDSDIVRLALIPTGNGYVVEADFPEHTTQKQEITVTRPGGYSLSAAARLDGVGFDLQPGAEISQALAAGEVVTFRWSLTPRQAGRHRLALNLVLHWTPLPGESGAAHEQHVYSRALQVEVTSILGLTYNQAAWMGLILIVLLAVGLVSGGAWTWRRRRGVYTLALPNTRVRIEPLPGMNLNPDEAALMRAAFEDYARVAVTAEFLSGYSGAHTWLVVPVHADGRQDAQTIIKIGPMEVVQAEYDRYQQFVKDTLPPVTARIQQPPIRLRGARKAALRYTFIGLAGQTPVSLRQALLDHPDPGLLQQMFETFAPYWWLQRRPYSFRLAAEYDHFLPAHLVIAPVQGPAAGMKVIRGSEPLAVRPFFQPGDRVQLRDFQKSEAQVDGKSVTFEGRPGPGAPPVRVRCLAAQPGQLPKRVPLDGAVQATRWTLLRDLLRDCSLPDGWADPLEELPDWLDRMVTGTQAVIHGDLNLENILVGPGGLTWLIDFARTKMGHPLEDFAHLSAEITAHVLSRRMTPDEFVQVLESDGDPLLAVIQGMVRRCMADPDHMEEWHLALAVTSLGMVKYRTIDQQSRHFLYLLAAWAGRKISKK